MKRLDDWLTQSVGQPELLKAARAKVVLERWPEVVGELLAAKCVPDQYDHGTLWVTTSGSAWAQELRLNQELILERLNDIAGERLFTALRSSSGTRRDTSR